LDKTLFTIQNQTYSNIEILVIDDGSKSENSIVVQRICSKYDKCSYYWKENTGQPSSRNYGIERAKGNYIAFCDDDDFWVLDKLEKQMKILESESEYDIVTGSFERIDGKGKSLNSIKSHKGNNHGYIFEKLLLKNRIGSPTPLLRKSVFETTGLFNPKFTIAEDWDFWRRASYYHKFYALDEVLAFVRIHDSNMSYKLISVYDRIKLYRKLTRELLYWGRNKFSSEDLHLIFHHEKLEYRRLISNHYNTKKSQFLFLLSILFKRPLDGFHILNLFLTKK
jgi:glycosyltransferase involved in cell wall biosynthesis